MSNSIKFNTSEVFYIIKTRSIIPNNGSIIFVVGNHQWILWSLFCVEKNPILPIMKSDQTTH